MACLLLAIFPLARASTPVAEHDAARDATLLADLVPEVRRALAGIDDLPAPSDPAVLDLVYAAGQPVELDLGELVVRADARWFAALPDDEPGAPIALLHRWPGDTIVALYAVGAQRESGPPIADGSFEVDDEEAGFDHWRGTVLTAVGATPAHWLERTVPDASARLGVLILAGDAGLGQAGIDVMTQEALGVVGRIEIREPAWRHRKGIPPGETVRVPHVEAVPGDKTEDDAPWQIAAGDGFTLGLPPGFRAIRLDLGLIAPGTVPGGLLWLRGRFRDSTGALVAVGDAERYGYVARVTDPAKEWASGALPPLGAPGAEREAAEPFPTAAERTGARQASAERWTEAGFAGDWLVFRLLLEQAGYEIALPVLGGRRSPSLFWIPATWRRAGLPPAPPPVDPAERFGIRFERLTPLDRRKLPWVEGYLTVPGMQLDVARGWTPAASLRSADGYPVRFVDAAGKTVGALHRVDAAEVRTWIEGRPDLAADDKPGRHRAVQVYRDAAGRHLFVAGEGHGYVFEPDAAVPAEARDELWTLMMRSVRLKKAS